MGRRKKKKIVNKFRLDLGKLHRDLNPETKESIVSIASFVLGVFAVLAWFDSAGPAGVLFYKASFSLFGQAYFMVPLIFFIFGLAFMFSMERHLFASAFFGGFLVLLSSLGLISILLDSSSAGFVGQIVSRPLIQLFDKVAAGAFLGAVLLIGTLITFNISFIRRITENDSEKQIDKNLKKENNKFTLFSRKKNDNELKVNGEVIKEEAQSVSDSSEDIAVDKNAELTVNGPEEEKQADKLFVPEKLFEGSKKNTTYNLPPLSLLENDKGKPSSGDIKANANIIQRTLEHFGIPVEMGEVNVGPSVTQYTLKPAQGIKLAKISALQNDLALALAAHPLRLEAPIPGKSLVGLEIPNRSIAFVGLRNLLSDERFINGGPLLYPLGKDVRGDSIFADLTVMPHLLVAGSTGSGKSANIHAMLASLLFKNSPDTLRLVLIDPKRVELIHYRDIPHLLSPVVTDARSAIKALKWVVSEMEKRYEVLAQAHARNIITYNSASDEPLPYIIVIIDELADLMLSNPREIEGSIVRIAQMARAVGIHLVVSTQRPSVEVITGLIKANITTRVAFLVASQIDSRTILDGSGAEKLLGNGDMLYLRGDASKPKRIQGAYITENEVKRLTTYLRKQTSAEYEEDFANSDPGSVLADFDDDMDDSLYEEAYDLVIKSGKASASFFQRRLRVGYSRAARLLDILEDRGVVGPANGSKPREILVDVEDNEEIYADD